MVVDDRTSFFSMRDTLENLSKDDSQGVSMVTLKDRALDFDSIKEKYAVFFNAPQTWSDGKKNEQYPSSVDAVLEWKINTYFVEFKNGAFDAANIRNKAEDSLLIYQRLREKPKDFEQCIFILVYNKNEVGDLAAHDKAHCVQVSKSRRLIHKTCARLGGGEIIRFGLHYLKMYYGDVHTYDVDEFEDYLKVVNGK